VDTLSLRERSVLVTGGAGFIGSHLVDRLAAEEPARVVVVDNLFLGKPANLDKARSLLGERLHCYWEDAGEPQRMSRILREENVDVVYDLAVVPLPASLEKPAWTVSENVRLTTTLCELQRAGLFRTLIHFSSSEVYGTARFVPITEQHPYVESTPYAASKSAGDMVALSYAHTFGLDVSVLRPFNNYGPRQNAGNFAGIIPIVVNCVKHGEPVRINGDGEQTRDYLFVTDTADAAIRIYMEPRTRGAVLNIGSGREITVNALVAAMLDLLGSPQHPVVHGPPRPGDVRRHMAGTERAAELIGFAPRVGLRDGLRETLAWYVGQTDAVRGC
jgi:UDP-glucose 4-epimerase